MKLENTDLNKPLVGIYEKALNNKFSFEEKIIIAKEAGFDFIEFSVDESDEKLARLDWDEKTIAQIRALLTKHDFSFNSMTLSAHRRFPFGSKDEQNVKRANEIMLKAIVLARKLGIRTIQLAGYDVYYEQGDEQSKKRFIEGIKNATLLAQKYSVMLAFETMDTLFMSTISRALYYVNKIDSPFLNIYPDLGNLFQFTKEYENEIMLGAKKIVAFHFKETLPGVFRNLWWGEGNVDFVSMLKVIKKANLKVPFLLEMWSKNQPNETMEQNKKLLKDSLDFFNKKWKEACSCE
ncbi:L-ribulose-5-phosphate 3-epimerase [Mycoplasmopsis pulmonis]|uniref:L-ribulose-5-phosphate 3-epimerase n=1 Tax=Mycoplasmopsis pulmonis TaxID=2107 RepID=UPI001005154F|nr:L-ribulose-5-phosphate 3-epimerase [Mycoplasmopsis pulmonis]MDZ7293601.1 L-ribulose-5-phosphate 3-epimerase [Mycoplasmopsis pulmonis]VEU68359.1 L-ribulose-5-phosphate 3-epimerase ulaE [Mycoplasmopsis pulmonis]